MDQKSPLGMSEIQEGKLSGILRKNCQVEPVNFKKVGL